MPDSRRPTTVEILLVEDNPGDIRLIQENLRETKVLNRMSVVRDGVEAISFLERDEPYADAPRPNLILLDLNLPRKNGHEVLAEIKADERFRSIPVVILTSSEEEQDIVRAYDSHANCYVTKPVGLDQFGQIVQSVECFWLSVVELPPSRATAPDASS